MNYIAAAMSHLHSMHLHGGWKVTPEEAEDEVDDSLPVVGGKDVPDEKNKEKPDLEKLPGYEETGLGPKTVPPNDEEAGRESHSSDDHEDLIDMSLPGIIDENIPQDQGHHHNVPEMEEIKGYEHVKFDSDICHPPKAQLLPDDASRPKHTFKSIPDISEDVARDALLNTVSQKFCWGTKAAKELNIIKFESATSYAYHLESYTEERAVEWKCVPFTPGVPVDEKSDETPPPQPWDVKIEPQHIFHDEIAHTEIPHTASIRGCHRCNQTGFLRCPSCHGRGKKKCSKCHGHGIRKVNYDDLWKVMKCTRCDGEKYRNCVTCKGSGHHKCETCKTLKKLKWFIRMTVTWKNHISEHLIERTPLPDELVYEVPGNICFYERHHKVLPVTDFRDNEINQISQKFVQEHHFPNKHIMMQRHRIRVVPVTECKCRWKDTDFEFIVYGLDNHIYCPAYPQQCCCGCSVL